MQTVDTLPCFVIQPAADAVSETGKKLSGICLLHWHSSFPPSFSNPVPTTATPSE